MMASRPIAPGKHIAHGRHDPRHSIRPRLRRTARTGGPMHLADPEVLQAGHARRRPDLRRRASDVAAAKRSGARAGGQRRVPARHPDRQPRHARYPLGLRLLHRRRLRHRPRERRRRLARGRGLRHQLRRPPHADKSQSRRYRACAREAHQPTAAGCARRSGAGRQPYFLPSRTPHADAAGRAVSEIPRARHRRRRRPDRGRGLHRRRET